MIKNLRILISWLESICWNKSIISVLTIRPHSNHQQSGHQHHSSQQSALLPPGWSLHRAYPPNTDSLMFSSSRAHQMFSLAPAEMWSLEHIFMLVVHRSRLANYALSSAHHRPACGKFRDKDCGSAGPSASRIKGSGGRHHSFWLNLHSRIMVRNIVVSSRGRWSWLRHTWLSP